MDVVLSANAFLLRPRAVKLRPRGCELCPCHVRADAEILFYFILFFPIHADKSCVRAVSARTRKIKIIKFFFSPSTQTQNIFFNFLKYIF
jgi:hypothetical protein